VKRLVLVLAMLGCHRAPPREVVIEGTGPPVEAEPEPVQIEPPPSPSGLRVESYRLPHHRLTSHDLYESTGAYTGHHSDNGDIFDNHGNYAGRIDPSNNVYDSRGQLIERLGDCDESCTQDAIARVLGH
jgi:hypothetical protein